MNALADAARAAMAQAYAPYSNFKVGSAIRSVGGRIFSGANVENAAFPLGNCAEASAIAAMIMAGERRIAEMLVMGGGDRPCSPCGGCRQRIAEFAAPDTIVHVWSPEGPRLSLRVEEWLPQGFSLASELRPARTLAALIAELEPGLVNPVGIVLGSGIAPLADLIEDPVVLPWSGIEGFPRPSVPGHQGEVVAGKLAGKAVIALRGRVHLYEGGPAFAMEPVIRALKEAGCETLILTNAAGSLRPQTGPGSIVVIADHINFAGTNPLIGRPDDNGRPRFLDMSAVYSRDLVDRAMRAAKGCGIRLETGVYLQTAGPVFETPAEIRAFRALGADLVGMSTVQEAIIARSLDMQVLGLSIVTNLAAGLADQALSHDQTLREAERAGGRCARLVETILADWDQP